MSEFSNRFRQLKDEAALTLKDLSEALDITSPNLSYYMKGREPSYDILIKIADYFNVTTDWLIGRTDARNTSQESLYKTIENSVSKNEKEKLSGNQKSCYLKCQNTLYSLMTSLYTSFLFYGYSDSLIDYLSSQFNMCIGILSNFATYLNRMYVFTSKDNLLNFIKYGENCAEVQKILLLSTIYNYAKYISSYDPDISNKDKSSLKEITDFLFEKFIEKYPEVELVKLYDELNHFELNEHSTSKEKFTQ